MKIGLDVMGGDFAPRSTIGGAAGALDRLSGDDKIVLIGDEQVIHDELSNAGSDADQFEIVHARDTIGMGDSPTKAFIQKPESSIAKGFQLLRDGHIHAFASAGNTGAMLVGSIYSINTVQGVIRPASSAILPKENGKLSVLIDVGTNPDPKPDVLYQFGILGSVYATHVFGIENPRVGLLNIGEEEEKGNLLTQTAHPLMKGSKDFNFIGNVETRDLLKDKADVIVCDGFTGNVLLKNLEAIYRLLVKRGLTDDYILRMNYENYGGTPLLGVNAPVILGHGISKEHAVMNMIILGKEVYEAGLHAKIRKALMRSSLYNNTD